MIDYEVPFNHALLRYIIEDEREGKAPYRELIYYGDIELGWIVPVTQGGFKTYHHTHQDNPLALGYHVIHRTRRDLKRAVIKNFATAYQRRGKEFLQ